MQLLSQFTQFTRRQTKQRHAMQRQTKQRQRLITAAFFQSLLRALILLTSLCVPNVMASDAYWHYSYELEREDKSENKINQQHVIARKSKHWRTALEYSHDRKNRRQQDIDNIEAFEWKQSYHWHSANNRQRQYKVEHKLVHPKPDTGFNAELVLTGQQHFMQHFKFKGESVLNYLKQDKTDLYKHSLEAELRYAIHGEHWQQSWILDLNASRNIQQADYYRVTDSELSFQPKLKINARAIVKFQLGLTYNFIAEDWFVSSGFKLKYSL